MFVLSLEVNKEPQTLDKLKIYNNIQYRSLTEELVSPTRHSGV